MIPSLLDTCKPREDVLEGSLGEDEFAANLASVAFDPDDTAPVYRDPNEFFQATYPTEGLQTLLTTLTSRFLTAVGHESEYNASILCLDTSFGGGKTHDLIASHHLATHPDRISNLAQHLADPDLATAYQDAVEDGLSPRTAVFVGGYVDARNARSDSNDPNAPNTNTMWGEIAYQLYENDGYEYLKEYDRDLNSPGENTLRGLFDLSDDPVVILVDEIAQYLEDASAVRAVEATLSSQTLSFMKSLLETASNTSHVTIVYSIADTAFTDEAETVRREIKELDSIEQRQQRTITPTGDYEVSSVLRKRLFEEVDPDAAEVVSERLYQFYVDTDRQLPQHVVEAGYRERLEADYPFHPSTINTLTDKIDSIQDFQKTRDALRLLARAIYHLWNNPPNEYDRYVLRLYDLTPADNAPSGSIRTKLSNTLFEAVDLDAAVSADIFSEDGSSHAQREDAKWHERGFPAIGSHIVTTVLWNSLVHGEKATGVTRAELYESVGHPDVPFDHYDSALENLTGTDHQVGCYYLYDEDRIKFKADPRLLYIIDQYAENTARAKARSRFENRVRREIGTGGFQTTPTSSPDSAFPEEPADLPDSPTTPTLAIMHFDSVAISDGGDEIPGKIETLYANTASSHNAPTQTRTYKNYVLFLVPDSELVENGIDTARRLEGMERLREDSQQSAQLSDEQFDELRERVDTHRGLLGEQVRNVYRHLFYPDRDGLEHIAITAVDANGDSTMVEAVEKTLDDRILRDDDGARGEVWFKQRLWQQTKNRMTTKDLAYQFAKKPGLPYLFSTKPLRKTVARMVREAGYAYWDNEENIAYWAGGDDPAKWDHRGDLSDSPDVRTTISTTDVRIGEEYFLFEDMDALLEQHSPTPPEIDEDEEKEDDEPEPEPEPPLERWSHTSDTASAQRAFGDVRDNAIADAPDDAVPALGELTIEVGGSKVLEHGFFLAQRSLDDYAEGTTASMEYTAQDTDGETRFQATFSGSLEDFNTLNQRFEGFSDTDGQRRVDLAFRVNLSEPEDIDDDETDLLADLRDSLGGTDITVQVQASGPIRMEVKA